MDKKTLRILAIDDDPADLKLLRRTLAQVSNWETELFEFSSWYDARLELEKLPIDVILVDYLLGEQTGLEVVKEIRGKGDERPIIVLTGQGDEVIAAEIMRAGADDYLVKKFLDQDMLRRAITNALSQYQLRQEKALLTEELQQAQKMETIGTLTGGIAHDFNNILSPIIGYADMAKEDLPEDSPIQQNLDQILQSSYRARDLVKHLLTFSRQGDKEKTPLQISALIKEVLKLMRASLPATVEIRQSLIAQGDCILGDPTQMHQVLMNLIANAAHAMREKGGLLEVSLTKEYLDRDKAHAPPILEPGDYLKLTVRDTGHGIPPDTVHKIFDPFFSTKERGEGTGLGLSVVQGIVSSHGGKITVESEMGCGTMFTIYYPCLKSLEKSATASAPSPPPRGNERILVIDDEDALVRAHGQILERLGYTVVATTDSLDALETFRSTPNQFDLVLTDQTMPKMTGVELAKEVRKIRPNISIILCTGFSDIVDAENAIDYGIDKLIMKPLDRNTLAVSIRQVLDEEHCNTIAV